MPLFLKNIRRQKLKPNLYDVEFVSLFTELSNLVSKQSYDTIINCHLYLKKAKSDTLKP